MKKCTLCLLEKDISEFSTKTGTIYTRCRECRNKKACEWRVNNPEKIKAIKKREYQKNKERYAKANQAWAENNRERSNEIKKACKIRHKEKYNKQQREYAHSQYHDNPESLKKITARNHFKHAMYAGKIERPEVCSKCGLKCIPDGHHEDYDKEYEVVWLCRQCHSDIHPQKPKKSI